LGLVTRVKIGIIGCGEVAQINHLPSLGFLGDLFEVTALSDVSSAVLGGSANSTVLKNAFSTTVTLSKMPR
jgi:predicted dehydrogenase